MMKNLDKLIILNNIRHTDSTRMKLMMISTYFYILSLIIMCVFIIINFSQLYNQYGGITSQNCIITVLYSSVECWLIEFLSYTNYDKLTFHIILWYSTKPSNLMTKSHQYSVICSKQFFDSIIITNIEIFGIILSELSISFGKESRFDYMINAIIIVFILLISLFVLIRKMKLQFTKRIINIRRGRFLNITMIDIKDEIKKITKQIHINNIKIYKIENGQLMRFKQLLGDKMFNDITDNMF